MSTVRAGRQNGVGLNAMCSRVAGILAPLIRLLKIYHYSIPMVIYGVIPIVAGGFCLLLPETLNVELQDVAEVQWVWLTSSQQRVRALVFTFLEP